MTNDLHLAVIQFFIDDAIQRELAHLLPSQSRRAAPAEIWDFPVPRQRDVDVIAFVQIPRVRPEIALQGAHRCADIIGRIAADVMAVRNSTNEPIAQHSPPS
jgi:hypothetical protein